MRSMARVIRMVPVSVMSSNFAPLLIRHLDQQFGPTEAGIIDQHIDSAEFFFSLTDQALHVIFNGNIGQPAIHPLQPGFRLQVFNRLSEPLWVYIADHQRTAALFGSSGGRGETNTRPGGGGDQHGFTRQQLNGRRHMQGVL